MLKLRYEITVVCEVEARGVESAEAVVRRVCDDFKTISHKGGSGVLDVTSTSFAAKPRKPTRGARHA